MAQAIPVMARFLAACLVLLVASQQAAEGSQDAPSAEPRFRRKWRSSWPVSADDDLHDALAAADSLLAVRGRGAEHQPWPPKEQQPHNNPEHARHALLLLPVVSSTDNFVVGAALGIGGHPLTLKTSGVVAVMNGAGMALSGYVGHYLGLAFGVWACVFGAVIFTAVGALEFSSYLSGEDGLMDKLVETALTQNAWVLGLPMSLNNLATGVAGGLSGQNPIVLGLLTVLASLVLMHLGYWIGQCAGNRLPMDPRPVAGSAFLGLGLLQLWQVWPAFEKLLL